MATFDESELNVSEGMEYSMNDRDLYIEILDTYLEETADELAKMDGFAADGNMPDYATLVHALKSSSRLIGAAALGDEAYELEMKSKAGDVDFVRANHDALKAHVQKIFECIEAYKAE